jgi:site-specific DNA recombinase
VSRTIVKLELKLYDAGTMPKPQLKAGIYARISYVRREDGTKERLGVERQVPPCRELARRKGWTLVEPVYEDNDLSAFSGKRRPGYEQLLADAKAGRINVIVAWHADRLTRQPIENEALIELAERHGIQLATVTGEHDLATPSGRLHFRMLGSIARYESEHRAERLRLKFAEQARDGRPKGGGRRPFGFEADKLTVNEPEAALLRDAAQRLLAGECLYVILREWRARGVVTPAGNLWSSTSLRRALLAPRAAGLREHRGEVLGPAAWPAILDELTRKRLVELFARDGRRRQGRPRTYLLSGFATCGREECGRPLAGASAGAKRPKYACRRGISHHGCGQTWIDAPELDRYVTEMVITALSGPGFVERLKARLAWDGDTSALEAQREEDKRSLAELTRDRYVRRIITEPEYLVARRELDARIADAEEVLARQPQTRFLIDLPRSEKELRKAWLQRWTLEEQRRVVRMALRGLVVNPPKRGLPRFDPDRVDPDWRV